MSGGTLIHKHMRTENEGFIPDACAVLLSLQLVAVEWTWKAGYIDGWSDTYAIDLLVSDFAFDYYLSDVKIVDVLTGMY